MAYAHAYACDACPAKCRLEAVTATPGSPDTSPVAPFACVRGYSTAWWRYTGTDHLPLPPEKHRGGSATAGWSIKSGEPRLFSCVECSHPCFLEVREPARADVCPLMNRKTAKFYPA